jgi:hypothetical protein
MRTSADLDPGTELDLVTGDRRTAAEARDLGVDLELVEHLGEGLDDPVVGGAALLVRAARLEEGAVGQGVRDVTGEGQLLDALRQRCGGGRLERSLVLDR